MDAVALIVQIHLQQNRNDLALKEVTAARRWAQDSLLVNLAESWVGLRQVGHTRRHTTSIPPLYPYPLLPGPFLILTALGVSVGRREISTSVLRLRGARASAGDIVGTDTGRPGRVGIAPRQDRGGAGCAGASVEEGSRICRRYRQSARFECDHRQKPGRADRVGILLIRVRPLVSRYSDEKIRSLKKADAQHPFLLDLAEKSELFDKAASKYKAKVAA